MAQGSVAPHRIALVPASVLVFAASGGRQVLVRPGAVALIAVTGGVIGTVAAGTLGYDALLRLGVLPMIMVGLIEEAAKLIVPIVVLIFSRNRSARAGVIVGSGERHGVPRRWRRWGTPSAPCSALAVWRHSRRQCCCGHCSPQPAMWHGRLDRRRALVGTRVLAQGSRRSRHFREGVTATHPDHLESAPPGFVTR